MVDPATGLYEQITGLAQPALTPHDVGAVWRLWIDGIFSETEMWGDPGAVPPVPPKMGWTDQTRVDLEAMRTHHDDLGQPQQARYFTLIEGVFVAWTSRATLLTKEQGEGALF